MSIPTWCNDESVEREKTTFLKYWQPKVEEIVGPDDAAVFMRELEKLMQTCAANARSKAEQSAFELRTKVVRALQSIGPIPGMDPSADYY